MKPLHKRIAWVALALGTLLLALCPGPATAQSEITIGGMGTKQYPPFGVEATGEQMYFGRFQQIYSSNTFPCTAVITQVAFSAYFPYTRHLEFELSVGLGTTTRTPSYPGVGFVEGLSAVFSGSVSAQLSSASRDFDLRIGFTQPFVYDPSHGNLALEIDVLSASGETNILDSYFDVRWNSPQMAMVMNESNNVVAVTNCGLVTRFYVVGLPGPPLKVSQEGTDAILSWSGTSFWRLQASSNLISNGWKDVSNTVAVAGTNFSARVPGSTPQQFFRLREVITP